MYRKLEKNTCIEIEHARGIVNQERNLNRTSLAKGEKKEKEKKIQTNSKQQQQQQ